MFKTIEQMGGIEQYLNDTKKDHNGLGYKELKRKLKDGVPIKRIATDFGVTPKAVSSSWIPRLEKHEAEKG